MRGCWCKPFVTGLAELRTGARMYKTILVPVENEPTDRTILDHVRKLAGLTRARLLVLHVADGWAARHFDELELQESEEMKNDRRYLAGLEQELRAEGFE